jgi:hypothetical protein
VTARKIVILTVVGALVGVTLNWLGVIGYLDRVLP